MTVAPASSAVSDGHEVPALREKLETFARESGYSHYTYISGKVIAGRRITDFDPRERPFRLTNVPAAWQKQYSDKRYYDHDPVLLFALHNVLPESWSSITERYALTARQRRVMADADNIGLRNGIIVPVHGPGGEFSVLSLSHAETARQGLANVVTDEAAIQMFALRFHSAVRALRSPAQGEPPADLTNREIDVLFWTAEGKSTWDISQILDIAEATVNFHINSAKRKLNVFSKSHAVAKMYTFGERRTF
jgi:DNA-binding CsgD family transcriptional regulator